MAFYDLPPEERAVLASQIQSDIATELRSRKFNRLYELFADADTYIRKNAYLAIGKLYIADKDLLPGIVSILDKLLEDDNFLVRQTTVNAAGEIGKTNFAVVEHFFDKGLFDAHHSVRNAVIGSIKKMGEKNPQPVLEWAKKYLHHADKEIRREICHGIELRGRTHPQDILPLLKELQFDKTARVRNTLVHVIGQISYKRNCLTTVVAELNTWENSELVVDALTEIIDVHDRYKNFASLTQQDAENYIRKHAR